MLYVAQTNNVQVYLRSLHCAYPLCESQIYIVFVQPKPSLLQGNKYHQLTSLLDVKSPLASVCGSQDCPSQKTLFLTGTLCLGTQTWRVGCQHLL